MHLEMKALFKQILKSVLVVLYAYCSQLKLAEDQGNSKNRNQYFLAHSQLKGNEKALINPARLISESFLCVMVSKLSKQCGVCQCGVAAASRVNVWAENRPAAPAEGIRAQIRICAVLRC